MSAPLDLPPFRSVVIDAGQKLSGDWTRWFQPFWSRVKAAVQVVGGVVSVTDQSAAIATTTLYTVTQSGTYRANWYARITTADGVSSSLQLTLTWREGSHTNTMAFTALTGDTTATYDGAAWVFHADSGTMVTYATSYASNTAQKMRYRLDLVAEQLN